MVEMLVVMILMIHTQTRLLHNLYHLDNPRQLKNVYTRNGQESYKKYSYISQYYHRHYLALQLEQKNRRISEYMYHFDTLQWDIDL